MNSKVDKYLEDGCMRCKFGATPDCKVNPWKDELKQLRRIVLDCGLTEELKWGVPCYTYQNKNILIVSALKDSATISFFKGALLNNHNKMLIKPGENSQSARYMKFIKVKDIIDNEANIKAAVFEAVEIEKAGIKVDFKRNPEPIPEELQQKLENDALFRTAFEALTPGRQRSYILHISQAKQSKTRTSRIEKCTPKILAGKGFNEY